jgi:hypothetical protein
VLEDIFPPGVAILYSFLTQSTFRPKLTYVLWFIKLCVAPESNKILTGLPWIEKVPVITAAPSRIPTICGEVETTLLDLHGLLLSLILIVLRLSPSLILLPGLRTGIHKMPGFPTIVAASFIVGEGRWGCIGPSILLLKIWGTEVPLLLILGRSHNPTP